MSPDPLKAKAIFLEAVEKHRPAKWDTFLDKACIDSPELRREVQVLLAAHAKSGEFLEDAAIACTIDQPPAEPPGTMVGPYEISEQIGEGGMGVVYMAQQHEPVQREVALKLIKPGMDSRQVIARFETERQALALMDHPNIARVLDAGGSESGRPYFVMDLVRGIPITEYCDEERLSTRRRLELFISACPAVQHAHQRGIIHRDIKPSNVLVTMRDDLPVPKVIDFGIAKATDRRLTEETSVTGLSQIVGTPLYMSPEQAEMDGLDVDTRSDVYSLGVLLYELLTGTTPLERERMSEVSYDELRRIIREEEPPRPSSRLSTLDAALDTVAEKHHTDPRTLSRQLSGELDWIVMKALEKDRTRRYESANEMAKDVQRYLNDEAVEACPPSTAYRFRKFARRNKTAVVASTAVALALIVGAAVATGQAIRATEAERLAEKRLTVADKQRRLAKRQEQLAREQKQLAEEVVESERQLRAEVERQRDSTEQNLYLAHMRMAQQDWEAGQIGRLHDMLDSHLPESGQHDFRGWAWYYSLSQCHQDLLTLEGHTRLVSSLAWSPDGRQVASASDDYTIKIWNLQRRQQEPVTLSGHTSGVTSVDWSPDGRRLASASSEGTIRIWNASPGYQLAAHPTYRLDRARSRARRLMEEGRHAEAIAMFLLGVIS